MSDVKWIKLSTDLFDDEKILLIETLPKCDEILVIWFKLLCLAGKQNNSGVFMMNEKIPYNLQMFSIIFKRNEKKVKNALEIFEKYGMVEVINDVVTIPNWEKHQSLNQLEMTREQTRKRVEKHREKQKKLVTGNTIVTLPVTVGNADRVDKNRVDKNREDNIIKEQQEGDLIMDEINVTQQRREIEARINKKWNEYDFSSQE